MSKFKRGDVIKWALYPSGAPADELLLAVVLSNGFARMIAGNSMGADNDGVLRFGDAGWQWAQDGGWVKV